MGATDHFRGDNPIRVGGLLCRASGWKNSQFHDSLLRSLVRLPFEQRLDLGCVLRVCAFQFSYFPNKRWVFTTRTETTISYFLDALLEGPSPSDGHSIDLLSYFEKTTLVLTVGDPTRPGEVPRPPTRRT